MLDMGASHFDMHVIVAGCAPMSEKLTMGLRLGLGVAKYSVLGYLWLLSYYSTLLE